MTKAFRLQNANFIIDNKLNYSSICSRFSDAKKVIDFCSVLDAKIFFRVNREKQLEILAAVQSKIQLLLKRIGN